MRYRLLLLSLAALLLFTGCGGKEMGQGEQSRDEAAIPIETVETDGFAMDYFRFGQGKDTLVILPGLSVQSVMGSADAVAEAYQLLTDDFTIYMFDRRKEIPEDYSTYDMARDTAKAIRALDLGPVCLFGVSQGGMMALDMAIREPELVQKLALGSASACVTEKLETTMERWVRLAEEGKAEDLYLDFGEVIYPREVFEQSRDLLVEAGKTVTEEELERFVILAKGMEGFDVLDDLDQITCPVLAIGSKDDQVLGVEGTEQIAERLGDACEMYLYDGYGHAAYDLAPDYKERLLRFLTAD